MPLAWGGRVVAPSAIGKSTPVPGSPPSVPVRTEDHPVRLRRRRRGAVEGMWRVGGARLEGGRREGRGREERRRAESGGVQKRRGAEVRVGGARHERWGRAGAASRCR
eukprot:178564-Prymnesium_polylepis.1